MTKICNAISLCISTWNSTICPDDSVVPYLTIIPLVPAGYEMIDSQQGAFNVLFKTPTKYREFFPTLFGKKKTTTYFHFEQMRTATYLKMAYIP